MDRLSGFVSLHPYFKVPPDKLASLEAILPEFAAKTRNEEGNLFYEFTINDDEVFCREGYVNAEALLEHLDNVGEMLAATLKMAELIRLEVHGPAAQLEKLKEPLASLIPRGSSCSGRDPQAETLKRKAHRDVSRTLWASLSMAFAMIRPLRLT